MHLLRISFLIVFLSITGSALFAQTDTSRSKPSAIPPATVGSVSGILVDDKNAPVSYATVALMRMDSSVINGDLSKDDGSFKIAPTGLGRFRLRIQSLELTTKYLTITITADSSDKKLGRIQVAQSQQSLKEVSVVGERPVVELKVDKKVFNVEKNITSAGGSATDVLQNVPSVSVDVDGNVSLRGKSNVTILIDGKPSTLLGSDVTSALQSLPAGSIESVEVITNPSAKYDAEGTSGIINIITKKDGRLGINGTATLGAGTRDKYNGNLGLNVRKGKWNVFLNSSFRLNSTFNNVTTDKKDKNDSFATHTYEHVPRDFNGTFNSIGASYDIDKNNSLTFTENINVMQFSFKDASYIQTYNHFNSDTIGRLSRNSSFSGGPFSTSTAIDYKHKFKKKDEELTADATYAYTTIHRSQDFTTSFPGAGADIIHQTAPGSGNNSTFNVWADYTDPLFTKNGKLGLGFKSQFYTFNSSSTPTIDTNGGKSYTDNQLTSNYNYTQQIHAAYINWNDQLGKFSYQLGLRAEDAIYNGSGQVPVDTTFHNSFFNLFPSAFISYQLPNQQSIYLNYSRRTSRPGFMQLLPFKDFSNPGTVNMGNPNLVPEFINNIEFSYSKSDSKGNNIIFSTYYTYTENLIERTPRAITLADSGLGLTPSMGLLSQPVNIKSGQTYGLEGTGHLQLLPIWDATLNLNFFENVLTAGANNSGLSDNNGFAWFGKVNTSVKLPANFSLQINGNYESPKVITQGTLSETYWVDVAVRKNLWKNKATLVVNCSDIFKTHKFITNYDQTQFYETINRYKETRIGNITFTYRFGKSDFGKNIAGGKKGKGDDKNKIIKPSDEDREKNMKEGDDSNDQGGGQGGPGGGGPKGPGGGQKGQ